MKPSNSKGKSDKFLYQDEAEEAINRLPAQGLRLTASKWELVEHQNRVTMTFRNSSDEEIEISFLPLGESEPTIENIKRALMNHRRITS